MDVLRLAGAGYTLQELAEALDMTHGALRSSLARVAVYLAPKIPGPRLVLDLSDCLPFIDERYQEAS